MSNIEALMQQMQMGGAPAMPQGADDNKPDTGEQIYISGLSILKMLKHCKAGVPFEVMGLMLGDIVDDYTITCEDVFSMPQMGTTVSVESVDPVYQQRFIELLAQVGQDKKVVGWYHSHPSFGPWLSHTDVQTQQSFENLESRAVAVVVDPIKSTKSGIDMDAFRSIPQNILAGLRMNQGPIEPRQTTSNIGLNRQQNTTALHRGLDKLYYSIAISLRLNENEQRMLGAMNKSTWTNSLKLEGYSTQHEKNVKALKTMENLTNQYSKWIQEETKISLKEFQVATAGKMNPRKHLGLTTDTVLTENVTHSLGTMLNTVVF